MKSPLGFSIQFVFAKLVFKNATKSNRIEGVIICKNEVKEFQAIKKYYKPIQPTVKSEKGKIIYKEVQPDKKLENFVYCFWQLKTQKPLNQPFIYRVVSDGCIDIFFDHNQPNQNFVMGFCKKYTEFPIGKTFDLSLIHI